MAKKKKGQPATREQILVSSCQHITAKKKNPALGELAKGQS